MQAYRSRFRGKQNYGSQASDGLDRSGARRWRRAMARLGFPSAAVAIAAVIGIFGEVTNWKWGIAGRALAFLDAGPSSNLDELADVVMRENPPLDDLGRAILDGVEFPPPETMPDHIKARVRELSTQYQGRIAKIPRRFFPTEVRDRDPGSGSAPRMDSGDPDPDRLTAAPRLPERN